MRNCPLNFDELKNMSTTKFQSPLLTQLAERIAKLPFDPTPQPYSVLIAITNEAEPKILYSLRASDMREHAGEVSFAGGRRGVEWQFCDSLCQLVQ